MTMKNRESGFYWVKWREGDDWEVSECVGDVFYLIGCELPRHESRMYQIDERRITRDGQERLVSLIKQARQEWLDHNDTKDGTDVVTPYDEVLYR